MTASQTVTRMTSWRDVPGYEGKYQVSDTGRVRYRPTLRVLRPWVGSHGYPCVTLCGNGKKVKHLVHRLVALTFIENPAGLPQVNHKNGIKTDNRAANLEWCTNRENALHSAYVLRNESTIAKRAVVCLDTGKVYSSAAEAARSVGSYNQNIIKCCQGKRNRAGGLRWKYAEVSA